MHTGVDIYVSISIWWCGTGLVISGMADIMTIDSLKLIKASLETQGR